MLSFSQKMFTSFSLHFYFFIQIALFWIIRLFFRIDYVFPERHLLYKSNAIILANHSANWDPFILGLFLRRHVCYITSDLHFRRPLVGLLLSAVGAIPKAKGKNDLRAIRKIINCSRLGKSIGIFPEGQASWDGTNIPPVSGTAKLVRLLKLPIFCFSIEGVYFSNARWMRGLRRGSIRIRMTRYISTAEQKSMSTSALHQVLSNGIATDACALQKVSQTVFSGSTPAQYLERIIFVCPSCLAQESMRSYHTHVRCKQCGYRIIYTKTGALALSENTPLITLPARTAHNDISADSSPNQITIRNYLLYQRRYFEKLLAQKKMGDASRPLISSKDLTLYTMKSSKKRKDIAGTLHGYTDRLEIVSNYFGDYSRTFPLKDISGFNIQKNEKAEFSYKGTVYQLIGPNARFAMLRWLVYINFFAPYACTGLSNE